MKKITIVMPYLNEETEPIETIKSIYEKVTTETEAQQQKQQDRAKKSYDDAEAEMLERRRQNMLRRKEGI